MSDERKETYPSIPAKHWWTLRKRFQQSTPSTITPSFLAATLNMAEQSAKANVLPYLIVMRIIDDEGKPTERARRWRDDTQYLEVCHEIRNELYPQELLDIAPGPSIDRPRVERWFAARTGVGEVAARRFAIVYELLTTASLSEKRKAVPRAARSEPAPRRKARSGASDESVAKQVQPSVLSAAVPSIHIDIQIHISPDAKLEQIDQIFASMARHLGTRNE